MKNLKRNSMVVIGVLVMALGGVSTVMAHGRHHHDRGDHVVRYIIVEPGYDHHYDIGKRTHLHHDKVHKVYRRSHHKHRPVYLRKRFSSHRPLHEDHYRDGVAIRIFKSF